MKLKVKDILEAKESLINLQTVNLPVKVSYKIMRLVSKLNPIFESYNKKKTDLVKEFADEEEKNGSISVTDPEKIKEYLIRHDELIDIEEEIDFEPIKIDFLGDIDIPAKDLVKFIFEE